MTNILNGGRTIIIVARENRISGLKNGHCPREQWKVYSSFEYEFQRRFLSDHHVEEEATNDDNIEECRHPRIYPFNVNIPA